MSRSKRSNEGYLIIDQRESPGIPAEMTRSVAQPGTQGHSDGGVPVSARKGLFEAATFTCSHCQRVVIINPDRQRDRLYCKKCDHYLCDNCGGILAATGVCKTYRQFTDELQEKALKEKLGHG